MYPLVFIKRKAKIMNQLIIENYFILFLIYSFLGWSIETIGEAIKSKKFVNRGFLIGPLCPVYGLGAVLITILLTRYESEYFVIFGLSAILCGSLEYFTSYIMEKLFKSRWWDYSNFKYNINGRICLETMGLFAIAGILIIKVINPLLSNYVIEPLPENIKEIICISIATMFLIDVILSLKIMNKIKNIKDSVTIQLKDNTEEISSKVKEIILEKSLLYRRIIKAFPQAFASKVKEGTKIIADTASKVKEKTIDNINIAKEKTISSVSELKKRTLNTINIAKIRTIEGVKNNKKKKEVRNIHLSMVSKRRIVKILRAIQGAKIRIIGKNQNMGEKNEIVK